MTHDRISVSQLRGGCSFYFERVRVWYSRWSHTMSQGHLDAGWSEEDALTFCIQASSYKRCRWCLKISGLHTICNLQLALSLHTDPFFVDGCLHKHRVKPSRPFRLRIEGYISPPASRDTQPDVQGRRWLSWQGRLVLSENENTAITACLMSKLGWLGTKFHTPALPTAILRKVCFESRMCMIRGWGLVWPCFRRLRDTDSCVISLARFVGRVMAAGPKTRKKQC